MTPHRTTIALLAVLALAVPAVAQATKDAGGKPPAKPAAPAEKAPAAMPDMKAMEQAFLEAGRTGPEHKILEQFAGEWDAAVTEFDPSGTTKTSTGKAVSTMMFDGRFLQMTYDGSMNGQPFRGHAMMGYCNLTKQFEHLWTDSMSTHMDMMTGSADAGGKTVTLRGEMPMPGGGTMKTRSVLAVASPSEYTMTYYGEMGGQEMKWMEIQFTKAGKKPATPASDKAAPRAAEKAAEKAKGH